MTDFVNVATRAVHDGGKLFDARYHMFLKAAESVYITLAPSKKVFLEARKTYQSGEETFKVFEVATCIHCHAEFLLGKVSIQNILEQENYLPDQEPRAAYLLADEVSDSDDEHSLEDEGEEIDGVFVFAVAAIDCDAHSRESLACLRVTDFHIARQIAGKKNLIHRQPLSRRNGQSCA